ncbi:hypothetical protein GCM10011491_11750 [Brucella endophytica]|uniref:Uncharacterized protein n=2 Tax=Brucella endophytica TaxID=1963359 RepID=A0A916S7R5_9HYPH|nr:hypothetical protein GCM10011491_11750 [Brucella endophytica]
MSYFPANDGIIYALDETSDAPPISIPLSIIDVQWVAVTQDGAYAYAGGIYASALSRVDLNKMQEKDTLPLPEPVYSFDVCNDGSKLFVSLETQVVIVDIAQNKVKGSIPYPEYRPKSFGQLSCSKTAPRACLSVASNQLVAVIDTATDSKLGTIPTPPSPFTTAFDEYGDSYIATQNGTLAIHYSVLEAMGPA